MKAKATWLAFVMTAAATTAVAQAPPAIGRVARTGDCVFESAIRSFRVLDDRHVVLIGYSQRDVYLAELAPGCFDVSSQSTLRTVDGDMNGQICGYGRDGIRFQQMAHLEDCRITALERLSRARAAALLGEPEQRPPPARRDKDEDKDEDTGEDKDPPGDRD